MPRLAGRGVLTRSSRQQLAAFSLLVALAAAPPPATVRAGIAAGYAHTCAVAQPGGAVKCWGDNGYGQLGLGDAAHRGDGPGQMGAALPAVDLGPGLSAAAIAAGYKHTCALLQPGGLVKCWGKNGDGQLGLGDTRDRGVRPNEMGAALTALDLGPGLSASAITAGCWHTCALLQPGGLVKCWGLNKYGQLGLGDTAKRGDGPGQMGAALPAVDLGPGLSAAAIAAGWHHNCALLQPGGLVKCWGDNEFGQLGLGDTAHRGDGPREMGAALPALDFGPGLSAAAITAGRWHTCALLQPGGRVKCWGSNEHGRLGLGDAPWRGWGPGQMGAALPALDLGPGLSVTAITARGDHTCALLQPGGPVACAGYNKHGQLGLGDTAHRGSQPGEMGAALPAVDLGPGLGAAAITGGGLHTCALLQPGVLVKCWGWNNVGQLGLGDTADRGDTPNEMGAALPALLEL